MIDRLQRRPVSIHYKRNVAMSELPCVTASLQIDLLSRISSYWFCLIDPLISPRSYTISFYVNWFVPKETAVLHQEDEPGHLPIKWSVLWGNGRRFWSHLYMVFRGGKPRFFPMKVSLIVVSHADLLEGSSQVTASRWGELRDKPKEPLKGRLR